MIVLYASHEGNAEEENNSYVVFKRNIRGKGEALLLPPFYKQAFGSIIM
jgi:hypothetical protein